MAKVQKAVQVNDGSSHNNNNNKEKEEDKDEDEKWVKHYSSLHKILLVGEGDFSFSTCLAQSFGSASNIVATSLDSYDNVIKIYKKAESNFTILEKFGASHLHEVDATKLKLYTDLKKCKFHRIIFNFPHAGFYGKEDNKDLIQMHKDLLDGFFRNASDMLQANGEIHVNHKTKAPFCQWNLEELANQNSLRLSEFVPFKKEDYPGYENKRGSGPRCDEPFPLGECYTFKFSFCPNAKLSKAKQNVTTPLKRRPPHELLQATKCATQHGNKHRQPRELLQAPLGSTWQENYIRQGQPHELHQAPVSIIHQLGNYLQHIQSRELLVQALVSLYQQGNYIQHIQPRELLLQAPPHATLHNNYLGQGQPHELLQAALHVNHRQPPQQGNHLPLPSNYTQQHMRGIPNCMAPLHINDIYRECCRIFGVYFECVSKAVGSSEHNPSYFIEEAIRLCYARFKAAEAGRTWSDYAIILDQLGSCLLGRQEWQVRRQQAAVDYNLPYNGRRGPFM